MPKLRRVVVLIVAALVTTGTAAIGLGRATRLWNRLVTQPACPVPPPVVVTLPAPAIRDEPKKDVAIGVLSVRDDAVEIEVEGRRHELEGYPPPSTKDHRQGTLTTAVVAPDGSRVAVAGACYGNSGTSDDVRPSCVRMFARVYRVADGAHVRDLKMDWDGSDDERRPLAIAFDEDAERLAVLVRTSWTDCMWGGDNIELFVYRLADGARLAHRLLDRKDRGGKRSLTFHGDEVQVRTVRADATLQVRVVRLRKPKAS